MDTTIRERRDAYLHTPGTKIPMCANCAHYYSHYNQYGQLLACGRCVRPRMKFRNAYDLCEHFEDKNAPSDAANP